MSETAGQRVRKLKGLAQASSQPPPGKDGLRERETNRRQHLLDAGFKLRIEELERQANYGMCAFLVLGDLLSNVRSNGGMTTDLIDNTFAELVSYFEARSPGGNHPIVKFVQSMWHGEASPP